MLRPILLTACVACVACVACLACATTSVDATQPSMPAADAVARPDLVSFVAASPALVQARAGAEARLAARGLALHVATTITLHTDPRSFMEASGQGDPELRAWTTYDEIHLMPLSSWTHVDAKSIEERLAHELCHAALYQNFASGERARAARIPRFFDEGACSVVAGQGARRLSAHQVVALAPRMPLDIATFRDDPELAYAAAHHAMALLDARYGPMFFSTLIRDAARDGSAGCVERALERVLATGVEGLWQLLVDSVGEAA